MQYRLKWNVDCKLNKKFRLKWNVDFKLSKACCQSSEKKTKNEAGNNVLEPSSASIFVAHPESMLGQLRFFWTNFRKKNHL